MGFTRALTMKCLRASVEKRTASGYGGVLVQACEHDGQVICVVYVLLGLQD